MLDELSRREIIKGGLGVGGAFLSAGLLEACGGSKAHTGLGKAAVRKYGGVLNIGAAGGGSADTLDPHVPLSTADIARNCNLFDLLCVAAPDFTIENRLAEEFSHNKAADVWTIRLRDGVEFHNGKSLVAEDLIYTMQRILDPKTNAQAAPQFSMVDPRGIKKLDKRTVRFFLTRPYALLTEEFSTRNTGILPVGFDLSKPVGTGPFAYSSFTKGVQSRFSSFKNYWAGRPYVDELVIVDLSDDSARVNALLSGQVQAVAAVPLGQVNVLKTNPKINLIVSETGAFRPLEMRSDQPPFNDVRVRQAMRLIANRPQMLEIALAGQGRIANDLYSPYDPVFAGDIPQREQDIEQAKSLLKQAGRAGLTVQLFTAPIEAGVVEVCEIYAQQAKAAGVQINVTKLPPNEYYNAQYLQRTLNVDWWSALRYFTQVALLDGPHGSFDGVHWHNTQFNDLFAQASRETDPVRRKAIAHEMQQMQHESGGLLIWAYPNTVDAASTAITGFVPDKSALGLTQFDCARVSFV
jgi:peptide/nickel transport system substrate-binding protein